jgi:hypothetical protein
LETGGSLVNIHNKGGHMKSTIVSTTKVFEPVTVQVTFETRDEVEKLRSALVLTSHSHALHATLVEIMNKQ